jgi:hypothetical protein
MGPRTGSDKFLNRVLVAFLIALFLFASPFNSVWMSPGTPWYVPYLIWLAIIAMTGVAQHWRGRHEL